MLTIHIFLFPLFNRFCLLWSLWEIVLFLTSWVKIRSENHLRRMYAFLALTLSKLHLTLLSGAVVIELWCFLRTYVELRAPLRTTIVDISYVFGVCKLAGVNWSFKFIVCMNIDINIVFLKSWGTLPIVAQICAFIWPWL